MLYHQIIVCAQETSSSLRDEGSSSQLK